MMEFILSHVEKGVMTLSVACYLQVPGADFVLVRILTIVTLIPQAPHRI